MRLPPSHLGHPLPTQLRAASFPCPRRPPTPYPVFPSLLDPPMIHPPRLCSGAPMLPLYVSLISFSEQRTKQGRPAPLFGKRDRQAERDRQRDFLGGKSQLFLCAGTELIFGGKDVRPELSHVANISIATYSRYRSSDSSSCCIERARGAPRELFVLVFVFGWRSLAYVRTCHVSLVRKYKDRLVSVLIPERSLHFRAE